MTRAFGLALAVVAALVFASTVEAAAPRYILVSGPGVAQPVLLADWSENLELLTALVGARHADAATVRGLSRRPRLRLGLFWGWPESPRPTRAAEASQTAWLYPATASEPAVVDVLVSGVRAPRAVPLAVLRILEAHGVPIRTGSSALDRSRPLRCTRTEIRTLARRFVRAFDTAQLDVLDDLVAPEPAFRWYSTASPGERKPTSIRARRSLFRYVARRHAHGERLHLLNLRVNGNTDANPPYGNFAFTLIRSAENLEPTRYQGKGAAYCFRTAPDVVLVWSMAPAG